MGFSDRFEIVGFITIVPGQLLLFAAITIGTTFGVIVYYVVLVSAIVLTIFGAPIASGVIQVIASSKNLLIATIEPRHVGSVNLYYSHPESDEIAPVDYYYDAQGRKKPVPRFMTTLHLLFPFYRHPLYGYQKKIYIEHNWGFNNRVWLRRGPASYAGIRITHGHRDRVTLSEQDEPEVEDWKKVPVFTLKRASWDYFIERGEVSLEELEVPQLASRRLVA